MCIVQKNAGRILLLCPITSTAHWVACYVGEGSGEWLSHFELPRNTSMWRCIDSPLAGGRVGRTRCEAAEFICHHCDVPKMLYTLTQKCKAQSDNEPTPCITHSAYGLFDDSVVKLPLDGRVTQHNQKAFSQWWSSSCSVWCIHCPIEWGNKRNS